MAVFDPFPEGVGVGGSIKNKTKNPQELSLTLNLTPLYSAIDVTSLRTKISVILNPD